MSWPEPGDPPDLNEYEPEPREEEEPSPDFLDLCERIDNGELSEPTP